MKLEILYTLTLDKTEKDNLIWALNEYMDYLATNGIVNDHLEQFEAAKSVINLLD